MIMRASSLMEICSCEAMEERCAMISGTGIRRKSYRWHRESTVTGTLASSVVAMMKITCSGGSSSVLSRALKALRESMWTSSMIKVLNLAVLGA